MPLVEALLLRVLRRREEDAPRDHPTRLVSATHEVDSLGYVAERTSVLRRRPGSAVEVLPAGALVLPSLLGRPSAYAVVTHDPVDVWLRLGPFETLDERVVRSVELRLTVTVSDSPSGLSDLVDAAVVRAPVGRSTGSSSSAGADGLGDPTALDGIGDMLLDRLGREVAARTTEALLPRTLGELADTSLGVLLDAALPTTFLSALVSRTALEVVDVDWPTQGSGWRGSLAALAPVPGGAARAPGPAVR